MQHKKYKSYMLFFRSPSEKYGENGTGFRLRERETGPKIAKQIYSF
jgi:hypothetical protein